MKNKINKFIHSKYLLISLIVLLILLVMATGTYAWFTWRSTNNTSLTMNIGKLTDVTFNSGNDISTSTLAPVYNYTDGEKTTFRINNKDTTGASLDYNIKLNITSIASELKSSDLKYVLLKDNTIVKEGNFSTMVVGANTIYSNSISSSGTTNFTFYLYIDGNSENNLNMMNKSLVGSIVVEAQEKQFETFSTVIENLMADGEKETVTGKGTDYEYNTTNSIMFDNFENYRYYGANPNNYICLGSDATTCPDDNLFRIIGVFGDKVKVIKDKSVVKMHWDTSNYNTWSISSLNTYLNGTYLTSMGTLSDKIDVATWKVGGNTWDNISVSTAKEVYDYEIKNPSTTASTGETEYSAKIGLMYVSDYMFAVLQDNWTLVAYNSNDATKDYNSSLSPMYLRKSQAERSLEEKQERQGE